MVIEPGVSTRELRGCDMEYANLDFERRERTGAPEIIYGAGKTPTQIIGIIKAMISGGEESVLVTRLDSDKYKEVSDALDKDDVKYKYYEDAKALITGDIKAPDGIGYVAVVTGGTSDIPVAEEACVTLEYLGNEVKRIYDVGVAGIHRLLKREEDLKNATVVIAIAGMEGALASVVGGLVRAPVIAVPTSIGYGANFGGLSALLSMLNSCASGVSVVNIDNGFGAGFQASMINHVGK
ncbi:MAG: nickel pincer cofactor biosynthesis protein LarB [Lachnospiraceae bacterium]|nr:nickel pincer cofactor biosynthesis protein LarB [Lachnospiraceae bacterium]